MLFCRKTLLFFLEINTKFFLLSSPPSSPRRRRHRSIAPPSHVLCEQQAASTVDPVVGVQHPLCSSDVRHQNSSLMGRSSRWCSRSGNVLDVMRSSPSPSHCTISPTSSGGAIGTTTSFFLGSSPISTAPRTCTGPAVSCPPSVPPSLCLWQKLSLVVVAAVQAEH